VLEVIECISFSSSFITEARDYTVQTEMSRLSIIPYSTS
jgi:hypothetical protein